MTTEPSLYHVANEQVFIMQRQIEADRIIEQLVYHRHLTHMERHELTRQLADLFKRIETMR